MSLEEEENARGGVGRFIQKWVSGEKAVKTNSGESKKKTAVGEGLYFDFDRAQTLG